MTEIETNADVLDGLKGHAIVDWQPGDGGLHFEMDDGRILLVAIANNFLVLAVYKPASHVVH